MEWIAKVKGPAHHTGYAKGGYLRSRTRKIVFAFPAPDGLMIGRGAAIQPAFLPRSPGTCTVCALVRPTVSLADGLWHLYRPLIELYRPEYRLGSSGVHPLFCPKLQVRPYPAVRVQSSASVDEGRDRAGMFSEMEFSLRYDNSGVRGSD